MKETLFLPGQNDTAMRKKSVFLFLAIFTAILLLPGCSQKKLKVKLFIEKINFEHQLVINRLDALERSLESYVPGIMDKTYQEALDQLDSSETVIRNLKPLKGEDDLRYDALVMFDTYWLLLTNEYAEIVTRQKKPAGTFTAADEFLVANLGKFIGINRKRAKEKYEKAAALVLEKHDLQFEPVTGELPEISSAKTKDSAAPAP